MNKQNSFSSHFRRVTDPELLSNLVGLLRDYPILREAAAISDDELAEKRRVLGDEIARLQANFDAKAPAMRAAAQRAGRDVAEIEPKYEAAVVRLRRANHDLSVLDYETSMFIERARGELARIADPMIDDTIATLRQLHQENLSVQPTFAGHVYSGERDRAGHRIVSAARSNRPSLIRRSAAILAAIEEALALKREVNVDDLPARLDKLIADLPSGAEIVQERVS